MQVDILLFCVLAFLLTAAIAVCLAKRAAATALVYGAATVVSAIACATALTSLLNNQTASARLPLGLPWLGSSFHLDPLSAFFLVVVNLGAAAASLYGLGYGRHEPAPERVLPFFAAFLAGMNLVVLADDAFTFLLAWEFMSLISWALVVSHHRSQDNLRAGYVYILMASFGTFALLLGYGLLAGTAGHYGFEAIRANHPDAFYSALVLGLALLGGITAVMGVLYALMEHDLKRLLAYHTIENIGIIFIGLGLALAFEANQMPAAAALALTAALLHVFNHALFKSLLFFGAGAVLPATSERDMERLGGRIHRMPQTALAFLVGCAAISALPPLNGFVSEWMTFQAILLSPQLPQWGLRFSVPAVGALLALSAALAAACFVKAFGVSFLGRPRTAAAAKAEEVDGFSLSAMALFATLCVVAGILPGFFIDALGPATQHLLGSRMPAQSPIAWMSIVPISQSRSSYNGLLVFIFIALSASISAYAIHVLASKAKRRAPAWDGGFPDARPQTQYTAGSFSQPIRRVFGTLVFRVREKVVIPLPGNTGPATHRLELEDVIWSIFYAPLSHAIAFLSDRLNVLQFLTIRRYLSLVFGALVTLLLVIAIWH